MILIFGGAYQGKLDYALERFGLSKVDVYFCREDCADTPEPAKIIYGLEKWLLTLVRNGADTGTAVRELVSRASGSIIVCADISCGIVPVEPEQRKWREATGKALSMLSLGASEVIRLYCGIPSKLK